MVTQDPIQELEARMERIERRMSRIDGAAEPVAEPPVARSPEAESPVAPLRPRPAGPDLEQLLGGRVLAWLGGAAVLVGLALLLALAIANGWLGELARTLLAGGASLALAGGATALHERHGRFEAVRAMIGTGLAGVFLTLAVATRAYHLIPPAVALPLAFATGAFAAALAVSWYTPSIAGFGIVGAILSPALTGAGF